MDGGNWKRNTSCKWWQVPKTYAVVLYWNPPPPAQESVRTKGRSTFQPNFLGFDRLAISLTHGASLTRFARRSSVMNWRPVPKAHARLQEELEREVENQRPTFLKFVLGLKDENTKTSFTFRTKRF